MTASSTTLYAEPKTSPEDSTGKTLQTILDDVSSAELGVTADGDTECRFVHTNGNVVTNRVEVSANRDGQGRLTRVVLTVLDSACETRETHETTAGTGDVTPGAGIAAMTLPPQTEFDLLDLVEPIQNYARLQRDANRERCNLGTLITDLKRNFAATLRETGHELRCDIPEDLELTTNPHTVIEILSEGIENALDHAFIEPGGRIEVRAREMQEHVILEVRDNGRGMAAEVRDRVFEPFFTTCRERSHQGLGLHIARQLAERLLSAGLWIESGPGWGTKVGLILHRG